MTIAKGKIFAAFLFAVALCIASTRTGYSAKICEVVSPKRFQKLHSYPVKIVVQFGEEARPETFNASLNGRNITIKFKEIENGVRTLVGTKDGLRIKVKRSPRHEINVLRIRTKGLKPEQHADFEMLFFVEVDKLTDVGPKGGVVESPDGHILIDIPERALSSTTKIAVTKMSGSRHLQYVYQLAPEGVRFSRPVTVTTKYDPTNLPAGIGEDELFLTLGDEFPKKMENISVSKTARTVSGTIMCTSKISMSYYMKIGKRLKDIPVAAEFRLPIGDNTDAPYSCGDDYKFPSENDLGETLTLLHRSSYPNFDYPKIVLHENEGAYRWHVMTAYNRNRYVNSALGPTRNSSSLFREDEGLFNNGEDWSLIGHRDEGKGLPIHAIADGLVVYSGWGYGNTIVLAHLIAGGPILSVYAHMNEKSPCVVGTVVRKGNIIGKIGGTGTRGAHLHYEIRKGPVIKVDAETGEMKVPATWFGAWTYDSVYENYYDPTDFLFNIMGKHKWEFNVNGSHEGWTAKNVKTYDDGHTYRVRNGMLSVKPTSNTPQIISYPLRVEADRFDSVFIRMKVDTTDGYGKVYFSTDEEPEYSEDKALEFETINDGKFHEYTVFMADNKKWKGIIVGIRIDLLDTVIGERTEVNFDNIRFARAYLSRTPDTGQTKCYDDSREIVCTARDRSFYGQDAHYVINPPSYQVKSINGHEVVIDLITGLMWQRYDDGIRRTWKEAVYYCQDLGLAGYSDWRLPTKKELQTILNYGCFSPVLDTAIFPYPHSADDCYWSSTTRAFLALSAWKVCFWDSQVKMTVKSDENYVRAVRARELQFCQLKDNHDGTVTDIATGLTWQQKETKTMTWEEALAYCENLDLAGHEDWRLPNIRELSTLVDDSHHNPSVDATYFPGCRPSIYWSSTTNAVYPSFAWYVGFNDGQVQGSGHKDRRYHVRAVRSEE